MRIFPPDIIGSVRESGKSSKMNEREDEEWEVVKEKKMVACSVLSSPMTCREERGRGGSVSAK